MRASRRRGFTLIEVVAALAVLAVAVGLCLQIATSALRQTRQAAEHTQAALLAQSLLDAAGTGERIRPGRTSGRLDEGYRWELEVTPYEGDLVREGALVPTLLAVRLYRLELSLSWDVGRDQRTVRFSTLRAMTPDPNDPVAP